MLESTAAITDGRCGTRSGLGEGHGGLSVFPGRGTYPRHVPRPSGLPFVSLRGDRDCDGSGNALADQVQVARRCAMPSHNTGEPNI